MGLPVWSVAAIFQQYGFWFNPYTASRVALAYRRSISGVETGKVYRVW
ncbi:hypothetical protein [Erwinia sp.]